jgi:hypothetical protein
MITLYLKTHNVTGLKYLGKTEQDPYQYRGSGIHWVRHLKKHGNDVTTEVLFQTEDKAEFKKVALGYSDKWNIVESTDFANQIPEEGHGGYTGNHTAWNKGKRASEWLTEEQIEYRSQRCRETLLGTKQTEEHKKRKAAALSRTITIDGVLYSSQKAAAETLGCSPAFISNIIKEQGGSRDIKLRPMGANQYTKSRA